MTGLVLAAAAGDGRVGVQPSLLIFGAVVILIAGFYLGRISDDLHRWWLDMWSTLGYWLSRVAMIAGVIAILWFGLRYWSRHKGGG